MAVFRFNNVKNEQLYQDVVHDLLSKPWIQWIIFPSVPKWDIE